MSTALLLTTGEEGKHSEQSTFVTLRLDNQLFGIPVEVVRDVLKNQNIAPVPRAPVEIMGSINLRGRIVNVINLRERFHLSTSYGKVPVFVVVEHNSEHYALLVDRASEVLNIATSAIEKSPPNVEARWQDMSKGVCRLKDELLLIIDVQKLLKV